jgi:hypothetical protein
VSTNAREFNFSLKKFEDLQPENLQKIQRGLTLGLAGGLMDESPVKTGRFRANWQVQSEGFATDALDRTDQTITQGENLAEVRNIKPFTLTGISNNLPYAERLNAGHSEQAPALFVEREIDRVSRLEVTTDG